MMMNFFVVIEFLVLFLGGWWWTASRVCDCRHWKATTNGWSVFHLALLFHSSFFIDFSIYSSKNCEIARADRRGQERSQVYLSNRNNNLDLFLILKIEQTITISICFRRKQVDYERGDSLFEDAELCLIVAANKRLHLLQLRELALINGTVKLEISANYLLIVFS